MLPSQKLTNGQRFLYGCLQTLDHIVGRKIGHKITKPIRVQLYKNVAKTLKKKGKGKLIEIDRVKNISAEDFQNKYLKKGVPLVLEGAALHWDSVKNWSLDYFKQKYGDDEIVIAGSGIEDEPFEISNLKDLINNIHAGGGKYYRFYPLLKRHPERLKDIDIEWIRKYRSNTGVGEAFQVFIGGKGTNTPLHNSIGANIFTQIHGEKHWRFYAPYDTMIVDPAPGKNFHRDAPFKSVKGSFDAFKRDFKPPYDLYEYLDCFETVLKPGDILYNPPHFWHAIKNNTDNVAMGYRWISFKLGCKSTKLYSILDFIAINPPLWKLIKNYKNDFNLINIKEKGLNKSYKSEMKKRTLKKEK